MSSFDFQQKVTQRMREKARHEKNRPPRKAHPTDFVGDPKEADSGATFSFQPPDNVPRDRNKASSETQDSPNRGANASTTSHGVFTREEEPQATPTGSLIANTGEDITAPSKTLSDRAASDGPPIQDLNLHDASNCPTPAGDVAPVPSSPNSRKRPAVNDPTSDSGRHAKVHGRILSGPTGFTGAPRQSGQLFDPSQDDPLHPKLESFGPVNSPTTPVLSPLEGAPQTYRARQEYDAPGFKANQSSLPTFSSRGNYIRQPETRPISQEQLVNEVKGIYAGLVMVEKKCVEIDQQQSATTTRLSNEQWQALIALHRTLLHEHHDFFLASQHPSASPGLLRLATKYAMPARMWRHGIHAFLELLRHRLPDSLDHMLTFVYLAYSMVALLMESVPSFEETWIECLGDLARYRMAIEEADLRDRETWSNVARYWYDKAADKTPRVGRIQHHLAVLARPNIVQQLFYYSKALVCVMPFLNARESVMLLFNPCLEDEEHITQRHPQFEVLFVKAHGVLFTNGLVTTFMDLVDGFVPLFDTHTGRLTSKFREQGPFIASTNIAALLGYGDSRNDLAKCLSKVEPNSDFVARVAATTAGFRSADLSLQLVERQYRQPSSPAFATHLGVFGRIYYHSPASHLAFTSLAILLQRVGDMNVLPFVHVSLAFLWSLAFVPFRFKYVEGDIPWEPLAKYLNTLRQTGIAMSSIKSECFPHSDNGPSQLPEDFVMRGQLWSQFYYPTNYFQEPLIDEEERALELPSMAAQRIGRCLWLGYRIAALGRYLSFDEQTRTFAATSLATAFHNAPGSTKLTEDIQMSE